MKNFRLQFTLANEVRCEEGCESVRRHLIVRFFLWRFVQERDEMLKHDPIFYRQQEAQKL